MKKQRALKNDWTRFTNWIATKPQITNPNTVVEIARGIIERTCGFETEHIAAVFLSNQHRVAGHSLVGIGGMSSAELLPPLLFRSFFKTRGASGIILCHNHPSGSLEASAQDLIFADHVAALCNALQVRIIDQLTITADSWRRIPFNKQAMLVLE